VNVTGGAVVSAGGRRAWRERRRPRVGVSEANALPMRTVQAYVGRDADDTTGSTFIGARDVTIATTLSYPAGGNSARSSATGSSGGLISVNATESNADNKSSVKSYVGNSTTILATKSINVDADAQTRQRADGDSLNIGLIAAGGNEVNATSDVDTSAYLGSEVTILGSTAVGGLTDGTLYYVVVDASNPNRVRLADSYSRAVSGTVR
jgi:hypothetical protein